MRTATAQALEVSQGVYLNRSRVYKETVVAIDFEQLYDQSGQDVFAYVASIVGHDAAEEVTAKAFESAIRKRAQYKPEKGTPRMWLFGIARYAALDELSHGKKHEQLNSKENLTEAVWDGHEEKFEQQAVVDAIKTLDERDREVIALKFYAGLGNSEIAKFLEVSETNVGTLIYRALDKVRDKVLAYE